MMIREVPRLTTSDYFQCALSQLQEMKASVLDASARVLRLAGGSALRESATHLYQRWEDVYEL